MTSPPLIIDILIGTIALGVPACLWIARPRDKPSAFELRESENRTIRAAAAWRAAKAARRNASGERKAFEAACQEHLALEMKCRATGWRGLGK